jgi:excisionase family DNA binding protein
MTGVDVPEVLTVAETSVRLRCSKAHVYNAINGKVKGVTLLPAVSMGRRKLIRAEALANWLAENEPGDAMIPASSGIGAVDASKGSNNA